MDLQKYLKKEFNHISLFENSFMGKEFALCLTMEKKLSQTIENTNEINTEYFKNVYKKATQIFEDIFKDDDEMYLIAHIRSELNMQKYYKTYIFNNHLKNPKDKYKLNFKQEILEEDDKVIEFSVLLSSKNNLSYKPLIHAICNQDFRMLRPRFKDKYTYYPEIFFINKNKNIILNIFDDRGCFILCNNANDYNFFSEKYKDFLREDY